MKQNTPRERPPEKVFQPYRWGWQKIDDPKLPKVTQFQSITPMSKCALLIPYNFTIWRGRPIKRDRNVNLELD